MQQVHAIIRAKRRYGLDLSMDDLQAMAEEIALGHATQMKRLSPERSLELVFCAKAGRALPVIYQIPTQRIVTVLPATAAQVVGRARRAKAQRVRMDGEPIEEGDAPPLESPLPTETPANNILAEALAKALREAGMLTPSSPSPA